MIQLIINLHHKVTKQKKLVLLFSLKTFLSVYLIWWLSERIDLGISFPTLLISFLIASYSGLILAFSELRFYLIFLLFCLLLVLLYSSSYFIISILQIISEQRFEFSFFYFQQYLYLIGLFATWGFIFNWFFFRWKKFFYIEVLFFASFMIILFKVHRGYQLSILNLFDRYIIAGISETMIFFIFIFLFFVFIVFFFLLDEESSRFKTTLQSIFKNKQTVWKTIFGLVILFFIIGALLYPWVKEEEIKRGGGIPVQFNENNFLKLYPKVSMNSKEAKLVVKMEINKRFNFVGRMVAGDNQYIRWKVLSGFDPSNNLFYYKKNKYELDIPEDSEDHFFRLSHGKKEIRMKPNVTQILLGLNHLLTHQNGFLLGSILNQFTETRNYDSQSYKKRKQINQEYYIMSFSKEAMLSINYPILTQPIKNKSPRFITSYRVESQVFNGIKRDLAQVLDYRGTDPGFLEYFTNAPSNPLYKQLALRVTAGKKTLLEKVIALVQYLSLNNEYKYSLAPGGEKKDDLLSYFLFTNKKGYCTYFAFSLAALTRSLDIPSRVVVGFLTDPYNKIENYYLVHAFNMHAWVEVYFKEYGWITLDATPSPQSRENIYINRQLLANLIESLEKKTEELDIDESIKLSKKKENESSQWYFLLYFFPFGILSILSVKRIYRFRCDYEKKPLKKIYFYYFFVQNSLRDLLIKRNPNETHYQYAEKLYKKENIDIRSLTSLYLEGKYNNNIPENSSEKLKEGFEQWQSTLKRRFPRWKRWLSTLNISFFLKK